MVLDKTPEIHIFLVFSTEGRHFLLVVFGITFPLREVRSVVPVSEDTKGRIGKKPRSILLHKGLVILRSGKFIEIHVESLLEKGNLSMIDFLVINLVQRVKLLL